MSFLRRRKGSDPPKKSEPSDEIPTDKIEPEDDDDKEKKRRRPDEEKKKAKWSCVDTCCWFIGLICSMWWLLLFMYNAMPASFPQYVTEAITGPMPDPPGVKLHKEGLSAKHPVVFVPGIVTGGLELWEGHQCADGLFRKRLWGGSFGEIYKSLISGSPIQSPHHCIAAVWSYGASPKVAHLLGWREETKF